MDDSIDETKEMSFKLIVSLQSTNHPFTIHLSSILIRQTLRCLGVITGEAIDCGNEFGTIVQLQLP